ncbi:phosphotransferase [Pontibacillus halophilus JSM 076056 = DSM 19796]|uniref:Phosphotransferase n=1 Tax=Pontibacillus halophilus JSM 076056 = DSM 19796 TaxID=1385510 RepID=A0A0A5GBJ6_9BACI|nr:phosphotransferase family protein [Pontibacillus halophilus]KGX89419.1 phosphotransferase [Pontibacillus halophilus JSM 076056 = DSM 19796]
MEQILGKDWTITPAGGSTGEAYYAQREGKRLFLKRNSSPFLAVLSAEGIVPKLVWTKRMENGDVITAQQWLEGRELSPGEINHHRVAQLLSKIHHSSELLDLLMRIGKKPLDPENILQALKAEEQEASFVNTNIEIHQSLRYLNEQLNHVQDQPKVVCHCDMNHNNWLLTDDDQLYLIDWDNAMVADPAMDLGMLLHWYVPEEEWAQWLELYGVDYNDALQKRMYWYIIAQTISFIQWHRNRKEDTEAARWLDDLKRLMVKLGIMNH